MDDQLRLLLDLQEVDEAVFEVRRKQKQLPEKVAAERAAMEEAEQALRASEDALKAQEASRRDYEAQLSDHEAHMQRLKSHIRDIANTREYQAYIQEMDGIQKSISDVEDRILEVLAEVDTVQEALTGLRATFEEKREVYETGRAKVDEELAQLETGVQDLLAKREERVASVEAAMLRRYQRIAQVVRKPVVKVIDYVCGGCNMNVPPQLVSQLRRGGSVEQCPHCQRILFVDRQPAEA